MNDNEDMVVVAARLNGAITWLRGPRELWILDYGKWRESYVVAGHDIPELDQSDRGGIHVVDANNASEFLKLVEKWRVSKDMLARELAIRYQQARSWWDVGDLFPIEFIDFD